MPNDTREKYIVFKQSDMQFCSYVRASSQVRPIWYSESIQVELTEPDFYQLVEDEREGRITFEDIKEKYTRQE